MPMRPRRPMCGDTSPHAEHSFQPAPLRGLIDCGGYTEAEAGAVALWRLLENYVQAHYRQLPPGTTLLVHPSVPRKILMAMEPDYDFFTSGKPLNLVPAEIPVVTVGDLPEGGWKLVEIKDVQGGTLP